jgi:hypothetical protein
VILQDVTGGMEDFILNKATSEQQGKHTAGGENLT